MNSTAHRPANPVTVFLAGLQAGMIGICWMLAWLGLSAMGQSRSFWTAENLMASVFHGGAAIRRGFGFSTFSGIALYLLVYSLLGAGFAVAGRHRVTGLGTGLTAAPPFAGASASAASAVSPSTCWSTACWAQGSPWPCAIGLPAWGRFWWACSFRWAGTACGFARSAKP